MAALADLADQARRSGVTVDLMVRPVDLTHGMALAAYRIVQEALTIPAAPARCLVSVDGDANGVRIDVVNDGPAHRLANGGQLAALAATQGGTCVTAPHNGRGFRVSVRLPHPVDD
ncbi:hypothetical protein D5S17_26110 [Pseudonocardiaceae bacterium YIM PH 21723]|nr:hypothetical protein D5S17_26110 [Pseudonocardiaceae bacterium YIM PH 21723]